MSAGGLMELAITQAVGSLTDRWGRKWGFLVYPSCVLFGHPPVPTVQPQPTHVWVDRRGGALNHEAPCCNLTTAPLCLN